MVSINKYMNNKYNTCNYEFRIRYKDPILQKHREILKRGFDSESEALCAAALIEKKILEKLHGYNS